MANRNLRLRRIALAAITLALLAIVAWRQWPDALRAGSWQVTRTTDAKTVTPNSQAVAASTSVDRSSGANGNGTRDKDDEAACYSDYRQNMGDYGDRLGSALNADEAVDRLMLETLAAGPGDWMSGVIVSKYQEARKRWPNDVQLAWLAFDHCGRGCDRDTEVQNLLSVDADNAAAWMEAMAAARSVHDEQGFARALRRAAGSKFYDSRMGTVFLNSRAVLARVPVPDSCRTPHELSRMQRNVGRDPTDDDRINLMASSLEAAIATPSFSGLIQCIPKAQPLPETQRRLCKTLLSRVARGDTLIEQIIANRGLLALEDDPARLVQLREEYRRLWWLQGQASVMPVPEHYATRMWSQGEVATLRALAIERHRWPPPPDWLPDDPHARALITGQPPPP